LDIYVEKQIQTMKKSKTIREYEALNSLAKHLS
jgi:hypothetical protein